MSGGTNWNWMRRMSHQWMNRIQVWTRDGMSLSKQLWIANDSIERRATLLSNRNNTWAISYLKVEKEINLFHYHGPIQYIQQQLSNNNNKQLSNEKTGNNSHQSLSTAKVAFMITSTQRKELQTLLGYTKDAIKSLNPTEAQIILQHHLPPTTEGQIKLQELIMLQSSEEKKKTNNNDNDTTIGSIQDNQTNNDNHHHNNIGLSNENQIDLSVTSQMTSEMSSSLVIVPKTSNDDSPIVDATLSPSNNNNNHTTKLSHDDDNSWYEVIQHTKFRNKETNKEMVREEAFALFRTKSEAQDCIDIKQKHATNDMDYTIRKKVFK